MVALGREDWSVRRQLDIRTSGCVTYSINPVSKEIGLLPALHPDVRHALEFVREELYTRCLSEDDATRYLRAKLEGAGEVEFEIRSDGPVGAPRERFDEVMRHVEAGCFIYSGPGWMEDGTPVFYLAGVS